VYSKKGGVVGKRGVAGKREEAYKWNIQG